MSSTGTVVRFDRRRGYGFISPDDGGEDVFVHQNNINMEGFRYLNNGERVSYELEVGEKGMKAVSVALLEPRKAEDVRPGFDDQPQQPLGEERDERDNPRPRFAAPPRAAAPAPRAPRGGDDEKARRKLERLISVLVEKGVISPSDLESAEAVVAAQAVL